jgi:transcriptional regulator with XRE-family HTH domain
MAGIGARFGRTTLGGFGSQSAAPGLKSAREAAGLTLGELSQRTGYPVQTLAALEGGLVVRMTEVSRVAAALGVDPAVLRGDKTEKGTS